jgi:hypothetical protein
MKLLKFIILTRKQNTSRFYDNKCTNEKHEGYNLNKLRVYQNTIKCSKSLRIIKKIPWLTKYVFSIINKKTNLIDSKACDYASNKS